MRRVLGIAMVVVVSATACGGTKSEGYGKDDRITAYELARGTFEYNVFADGSGEFKAGKSLKSLLPDALAAALDLVGGSIGVEMQYKAKVKAEIADDPAGQKVTLTYESLRGSVTIVGQTTQVGLDDLGKEVTVTYLLKKNGTTELKGRDPVADKFWLTGSPTAGCPRLPPGGADQDDAWTSEVRPSGPLDWFVDPTKWDADYTVKDDRAKVAAKTEDLNSLGIDTGRLIDRLNKALKTDIKRIDVKASLRAEGDLGMSCALSVPAQELQAVEQTASVSGDLRVAGESLPKGLVPGDLLGVDVTMTTSMKRA